MGDQLRIQRDRQAAIQDELSRFRHPLPSPTPRRLVKVTTAGSVPTCTPCYYVGNDVELDGDETEGASATATADTSATIPFILLRGSVSVGDILPIHGVGGRWVAEKGGCTTTICAQCFGLAEPGSTVTIKSGATVISSGTTGAGGCVALPIPTAGSYSVVLTVPDIGTTTTTHTLSCGGTTTIDICHTGGCPTCDFPASGLTLTTYFGTPDTGTVCSTDTLAFGVFGGIPRWYCPAPVCAGCPDGYYFWINCTGIEVHDGPPPGGILVAGEGFNTDPSTGNCTVNSCSPISIVFTFDRTDICGNTSLTSFEITS